MQLVSLAGTTPMPVTIPRELRAFARPRGMGALDLSDSVGLAGLAFVVGGALGFALGAAVASRAAGPRYY